MSLENYGKVFFGKSVPPTPVDVKAGSFLDEKKDEGPKKKDSFQGPGYGLKHLHGGKWQPKHLAKPGFLEGSAGKPKDSPKPGAYETAKARYDKADGEVETAKKEYEKLDNTAKAYKDLDPKKASLYSSKAAGAKKVYEQKILARHVAGQQLAKFGKPGQPTKGLALGGEELSGPLGSTLAKNHSALSAKKGATV